MHTGILEVSDDIFKIIEIAKIAKKWGLAELVDKCEEDIIAKLSAENVLDLLINFGKNPKENMFSEEIWDNAKTLFLKEFTYIQQLSPDLEKKIADVPFPQPNCNSYSKLSCGALEVSQLLHTYLVLNI